MAFMPEEPQAALVIPGTREQAANFHVRHPSQCAVIAPDCARAAAQCLHGRTLCAVQDIPGD